MKKVEVFFRGWGQEWALGTLAQNGSQVLFEYSRAALEKRIEFSRLNVPLTPQTYSGFPQYLLQLPGFIADALPDGWGMLLMDRVFRKAGRDPVSVTALDRLSFVGDRAMGALSFKPSTDIELTPEDITLRELAEAAIEVVEGRDTSALQTLALLGGSPQGARPKALVRFDQETGVVSTADAAGGDPWLVKFPAQGEHVEVCGIEVAYAQLAQQVGIDLPRTHLFKISAKLAAFGIERFDRCKGMRVPVQSFAAALHADFRVPSLDYQAILQATKLFTASYPEVEKAFVRCVFNVVFNNKDDHAKNFALRMNSALEWTLAPGFDMTFNQGPGGYHQTSVMGEARHPSRASLLALAKACDVDAAFALRTIDQVCGVAQSLESLLDSNGVRRATRKTIGDLVSANVARCLAPTITLSQS